MLSSATDLEESGFPLKTTSLGPILNDPTKSHVNQKEQVQVKFEPVALSRHKSEMEELKRN